MRHSISFLCLMLTVISCKESDSDTTEKEKIKEASWLIGKWENQTVDGILSENWEKLNDSTLVGKCFFIKNKDTLHFETIQLQQVGEELSYNTTIIGQNANKPIVLPEMESTENALAFENNSNDYPQKINYNLISKDSLSTEISGVQIGKPTSEKHVLLKVK